MFPFKTKRFSYQSKLDKQEVLKRLNVLSDKYYYKKNWKSIMINDIVECELKISYRNSFRPVIVVELLNGPDGKLSVSGYYKIADFLVYPALFFVFFCIYVEYKVGNVLPFFACLVIWSFVVQGIAYLFFNMEYRKVKKEFEQAIGVNRF